MNKYYSETCLFSGNASGNFTLYDDPNNYDYLRVLYCSKAIGQNMAIANNYPKNFSPMYSCDILSWQNSGYVNLNAEIYVSRSANGAFANVYDAVASYTATNTTAWKLYNNSECLRNATATTNTPFINVRGVYGINYGMYSGFKKEVIYSSDNSDYASYNKIGNIYLNKDPMQYERLGISFNCSPNSNQVPMYTEIQTDVLNDTSGYMLLQGFYSDKANMTDNLMSLTPWSGCSSTHWIRSSGVWYKNTNTAALGVGAPWIYTIYGIGEK